MEDRLTHIDENGRPRMVNGGKRPIRKRIAVAKGAFICIRTLKRVKRRIHRQRRRSLVAQTAGIMAAKKYGFEYSDVPQYFYHRRGYEF